MSSADKDTWHIAIINAGFLSPTVHFEFLSPQGRIFAGDILWVKKKNTHVSESDRPGNSDWIPRDS